MKSFTTSLFLLLTTLLSAQTVANFENLGLTAGTYNNNAGNSHQFSSGNVQLPNFYDATFDSWTGWAISANTDVTTPGYLNQYSAITGSGVNGSTTYAVCYIYGSEIMRMSGNAIGGVVQGLHLTNSTYAYLSMLEGDGFAKKFGGENGNDPDFFKVTVKKFRNGQLGSDSVEFYLADYRFANNTQDYIVKDWTYVDLSSLGNVDSLQFTLASSDVGMFGINTPTYFCVDDVRTTDMPSSTAQAIPTLKIKTWPNPATDFLQIDWDENSDATACLSTVYGKVITLQKLSPGQNQINVSDLPPGVFTLQVSHGEKVFSQIFIKQ